MNDIVRDKMTEALRQAVMAIESVRDDLIERKDLDPLIDYKLRRLEQIDHAEGSLESDLQDRTINTFVGLSRDFLEKMEQFGNWDDSCFYYNKTSAPELQQLIVKTKALLDSVRRNRSHKSS